MAYNEDLSKPYGVLFVSFDHGYTVLYLISHFAFM